MSDILTSIILVGEPATGKYELLSKQGIIVKSTDPLIARIIGVDIAKYCDLNVDGCKADLILKAIDHKSKLIPSDYYAAHAAIATYTAPDDINKLTLQTQLAKFYEKAGGAAPVAFWPFNEINREFETNIVKQFPDRTFLFSHEHSIDKRLEDLVRDLLENLDD